MEQVAFGREDQAGIGAKRLFEDLQTPEEVVKLGRFAIGLGGQLDDLGVGVAANFRRCFFHFSLNLIELLLRLTEDLILFLHRLRIVEPRDPQTF